MNEKTQGHAAVFQYKHGQCSGLLCSKLSGLLNEARPTVKLRFAEVFVFVNAKLTKKLEVFVWNLWTVEQEEAMHYVFPLEVVDL